MRKEVTERYTRTRGPISRRIEHEVLGHAVGLAGFTTVEQAHALADAVAGAPGGRLLDLGCGYGWPGFYVAKQLDRALVASDLPLDAVRQARANRLEHRVGAAGFVVADGRALPFADAKFGAVVHADVFC